MYDYIDINGIKTRYKQFGQDKKEHILFIHGLGSSLERFLDIPEALSKNYHTISFDMVGFGLSGIPEMNYTVANLAKFTLEFISKIGINDGNLTLVGHSLGGYIAAEITIENKNLVDRLVLIDSSGMIQSPTRLLNEYLDCAMNPSYDKVKNVFQQLVADPVRVFPILIDSFIKRMQFPNAKSAFKSAFENSTSTQIDLDRLQTISEIPSIVIWGAKDNLIPIEHSTIFSNALKSKLEIIPDTGHAPFAEKPSVLYEIMRSFFSNP